MDAPGTFFDSLTTWHFIDFPSTAIKLIQEICQWLSQIFLIMLISVAIASGTMVELDFAVTKIIPSTHFNAINFNCTLMYLKIRMYVCLNPHDDDAVAFCESSK